MLHDHRSGIYCITHTASGRQYVGSAVDLRQRWLTHLSVLRRDCHPNPKLQAAFNKYGESLFTFAVLEHVDEPTRLLAREQHYLDTMQPFYNICKTAGNKLGVPLPADAVEKMRAKLTGLKRSPETRLRQSLALKGRKRTPEQRERIKAARAHTSTETRAKMSAAKKGKPLSEACRAAQIIATSGLARSPEVREKIAAAQRGKPRHDLRGRIRSAEARANMSAAKQGYIPWAAIRAYSDKCTERRKASEAE